MDLFEILLFALIAGSGLLSEIFKKRRQEQAKRQREQTGEYSSTPETTESLDNEFEGIEGVSGSEGDPVLKDVDSLLEELIFGKPAKNTEKEKFERLTSLENRPAEDLYTSIERKTSYESQPSAEHKKSMGRQRSLEYHRSVERHPMKSEQGSEKLALSQDLSKLKPSTVRSSKMRAGVNKLLESPRSARQTLLAAEILSSPVSKRKGSSIARTASVVRAPRNV